MGEKEMEILKNVKEEIVLIETVPGEHSMSKIYGDTIVEGVGQYWCPSMQQRRCLK
jgi:hypothetical protein